MNCHPTKPEDLRVDTYRAGDQVTVKVTYIPSGRTVTASGTSQYLCRQAAMEEIEKCEICERFG